MIGGSGYTNDVLSDSSLTVSNPVTSATDTIALDNVSQAQLNGARQRHVHAHGVERYDDFEREQRRDEHAGDRGWYGADHVAIRQPCAHGAGDGRNARRECQLQQHRHSAERKWGHARA